MKRPQRTNSKQSTSTVTSKVTPSSAPGAMAPAYASLDQFPAHGTAQSLRQTAVLQMQRQQGNGATRQRLTESAPTGAQSTIQRDDPEPSERRTPAFFNYEGVSAASGRIDARRFRMEAYAQRGRRVVRDSQSKLMRLADHYRTAYGRYETAINAARASAQTQEMIQGVVIGALASVLVAAAAPLVLPAATVEAAAFTGTWWAVQGTSAAISSAGGTAVASALDVTGSDLQPGGLAPSTLESRIWHTLNDLNASINNLTSRSFELYMLGTASEYLLGEIRRHTEGGNPDMDEESVLDAVGDILAADRSFAALDRQLQQRINRLESAETAVQNFAAGSTSERRLEQDIWIIWMDSLAYSESDILDRDAIENRLHNIGVLGTPSRLNVDFGEYWTSEEDELNALRAAGPEAARLRRQYRGQG